VDKERGKTPKRIVFEDIVRVAKEMLLRDGYHVPTLVVDGSRQPAILQIRPLGETHEERMTQLYLAGVNLGLDGRLGMLRQVFLITEGWMSRNQEGNGLPEVPPSEDPSRVEILAVTNYDAVARKVEMALIEMVRTEDQHLVEIRDLVHTGTGDEVAESPLLEAFIAGYTAPYT
jgi:hypothetical protein